MDELFPMTQRGTREWLDAQWADVLDDPSFCEADSEIDAFVTGPKTIRYIAITQLLGKIADPARDILALQAGDSSADSWNARSLADQVVVPWERSEAVNFLGGSPEPYANNPARVPRLLRDRTDVRSPDQPVWRDLHDFLFQFQNCDQETRERGFRRLLGGARRALEKIQGLIYPVPRRISTARIVALLNDFLGNRSGGVRPLVLAAALFETLGEGFRLFSEVGVQGINEPDSAGAALGDITCVGPDGVVLIVVEVKDHLLTLHDLQTSIEKVRRPEANLANLVFAVPGVRPTDQPAVAERIESEHSAGTNVYHLSLTTLAESTFSLLLEGSRVGFLRRVGKRLDEMADYVHRRDWRDLLSSS